MKEASKKKRTKLTVVDEHFEFEEPAAMNTSSILDGWGVVVGYSYTPVGGETQTIVSFDTSKQLFVVETECGRYVSLLGPADLRAALRNRLRNITPPAAAAPPPLR